METRKYTQIWFKRTHSHLFCAVSVVLMVMILSRFCAASCSCALLWFLTWTPSSAIRLAIELLDWVVPRCSCAAISSVCVLANLPWVGFCPWLPLASSPVVVLVGAFVAAALPFLHRGSALLREEQRQGFQPLGGRRRAATMVLLVFIMMFGYVLVVACRCAATLGQMMCRAFVGKVSCGSGAFELRKVMLAGLLAQNRALTTGASIRQLETLLPVVVGMQLMASSGSLVTHSTGLESQDESDSLATVLRAWRRGTWLQVAQCRQTFQDGWTSFAPTQCSKVSALPPQKSSS